MALSKVDQRLDTLLTLVQEINADLSLPAVQNAIIVGARTLLSADSAFLAFRSDDCFRVAARTSLDSLTARIEPDYTTVEWRGSYEPAPWVIVDTSSDPLWKAVAPAYTNPEQIKAWIGNPLSVGDRCLALVGCAFTSVRAFEQKDLQTLRTFSDHASLALRNALQLHEETERARRATLRESFVETIQQATTQSNIASQAALAVRHAFNATWGMVVLSGEVGMTLPAVAGNDTHDGMLDKRGESAIVAVARHLMHHPQLVAVPDVANASHAVPVVNVNREALLHSGVRAVLGAPVVRGSEVIGAVFALHDRFPREWSEAERVLAEQFAADIAIVVQRVATLAAFERRFLEADAARSELEVMASQAPIGLLVADMPPHSLRFWNTAATGSAIEGTTMSARTDGTMPRFEAYRLDGTPYSQSDWPLTRAFQEGRSISSEESLLRLRDSTLASVLVAAAPTLDAFGRVTGAAASILDITQLRSMEQKFAACQRFNDRLVAAVDVLAGSASIGDALRDVLGSLRELLPVDVFAIRMQSEQGPLIEGAWPVAEHARMCDGGPASTSLLEILNRFDTRSVSTVDHETLSELVAADMAVGSAIFIPLGAATIRGALVLGSETVDVYGETEMAIAGQLGRVVSVLWSRQIQAKDATLVATRDERDRLARELHDVLAQMITSIVLQLEHILKDLRESDAERAPLEQVRTLARSAITETRRIVWNLRSAGAILEEPRAVVEEEAAKLERRIGVKPDVTSTGEERRLAPEIGAVIQRLARVALDNVWTHSEAKHVRIVIDFGLHALTLLIEDDGIGFDPDEVDLMRAGRVGLSGVAERLRVIGGTLRIESAANQGTRVWGVVPYAPSAPAPKVRPAQTLPRAADTATIESSAEPPDGRIRVVLIDDHSMVREGLEHMLSAEPDLQVVGAAATGSDGLRIIKEQRPDVVLCDLQLPDISGVEVISRVRTLFPDVRCVIVTTYDQDDMMYEGIKAGAKGYVLKDVSGHELAEAVRAAARNESLLQPVIAGKLLERFGEMARQGDMVEPLTDREIEVLQSLAKGSRNKEIALQLGLSESTIKTHLASIFGKLGVTTRTEAVTRGRELGLIPL